MGEERNETWPWLPKRLGRKWFGRFEVLVTFHTAVAGVCLKAFDELYPVIWWPLFGFVGLVWFQLSAKGLAEAERLAKATADEELKLEAQRAKDAEARAKTAGLDALVNYKWEMAGNIARLLKNLHDGTNHTRLLQSAFLHHAVDVVKDALNIPRKDTKISATWVVPCDGYSQWVTVAYDRNLSARQAGQKRAISPGVPGVSEAFLTGNDVYVRDTTEKTVAQHFGVAPKYRTIVSVPARMQNVTHAPNVHINGHPNVIIGVLNIDASEADILPINTADYVRDIAFLIGVLEHINRQLGGGSDGKAEERSAG